MKGLNLNHECTLWPEPQAHEARPQRVQLSRRKGWRMPPNCVKVDRSTKWGNHFAIGKCSIYGDVPDAETAVRCFEVWLKTTPAGGDMLSAARAELRGFHLACWCAPGLPCHADVLLSVANT